MAKFFFRTVLLAASVGLAAFFGRMVWDLVDNEKSWHPVERVPAE